MLPNTLIPPVYRVIGWAILVAALLGLVTYQIVSFGHAQRKAGDSAGYQRGHAEAVDIQSRWDADKLNWQAQTIVAQQDAATRIQFLTKENERITHEKDQVIAELRVSAAAAGAQLAGLRQQVDAFTAAATGGGEACTGAGTASLCAAIETFRGLFKDSAARYVELASQADIDHAAGVECEQRYDAVRAATQAAVGSPADAQ